MHRRLLLISTLAATAAMGAVAAADAASPAPFPTVTKVAPLNLGIGDTMTITGKHFRPGKNKNTVVFKRDKGRAIFVKAGEASSTKLTVVVPEKLRVSLGKSGGKVVPTKFRIRVLAKRFARTYTALRTSPTVAPEPMVGPAAEERKQEIAATKAAEAKAKADAVVAAQTPPAAPAQQAKPPSDCDRDGLLDEVDGDDDNDKLLDALEGTLKTDACRADTDGDGMSDGWEYKSAYDLNQRSCPSVVDGYPVPCAAAYPYPSQRPYPNPLDGKDGDRDHDGDSLTGIEEYTATSRHGDLDLTQLWYSGGLKASQDSGGDGCRGLTVPPVFNADGVRPEFQRADGSYPNVLLPEYQVYSLDSLDPDGPDGCLHDGERDEDNDFLTNFLEAHGRMSGPDLWSGSFQEPKYSVIYAGTDWLDTDTDGDGVQDGLDDQDHDDFLNIEEIARGPQSRIKEDKDTFLRSGLWVDAFNPCLPAYTSRTCSVFPPVGDEPWRPFAKPESDPPLPRWPLYGSWIYNPYDPPEKVENGPDMTPVELWDGLAPNQQTMPPDHPLPR